MKGRKITLVISDDASLKRVIASEAKQSGQTQSPDGVVASLLAMTQRTGVAAFENRYTLKFFLGVMLAVSACSSQCVLAQPARLPDLPTEVMALISRRINCQQYSGRGKENGMQHENFMNSLDCSNVAHDEQVLRDKYAATPGVLAALDATWIKVVRRVPVQVPPGVFAPRSQR